MHTVHSDTVFTIDPATGKPDYDRGNSLLALADIVTRLRQQLAAEQGAYIGASIQFLVPFTDLELYGPATPETWTITDPEQQDDKNDFQKQNIKQFQTADTQLVRGWVRGTGQTPVPFLRLTYRAGPDSELSRLTGHTLGDSIKVWLQVASNSVTSTLTVPYNHESDTYAIELWGKVDDNPLDARAQKAMERGELIIHPDLMWGTAADFARDGLDDVDIQTRLPEHPMHPINPLPIQVAWADAAETVRDSMEGENHRYAFTMKVRGWEHYLQAGISPNPHGGIGFLEFRNLFSNYFGFARGQRELDPDQTTELGRRLQAWNPDANGNKGPEGRMEDFLAVDYMDLHSVNPKSGIGIHRHRDNSEVFLMMEGQALMVLGDWCRFPDRERAFEVRTLDPGHLALLKGGQLHGLLNLDDQACRLFMFGGYD